MGVGYGMSGIKSDFTAWSWGINTQGDLGDGTITKRLSPVPVVGDTKFVASGGNVQLLLDLYDIAATNSSSLIATILSCGNTLPTTLGSSATILAFSYKS